MKYFSDLLKKEIEIKTTPVNGADLIDHNDLVRAFMTETNDVVFEYTFIKSDVDHSVVLCHFKGDGRDTVGVGETTAATISDEISKDYPSLMAAKRAFDDGCMKYLGIFDRTYTSAQITKTAEPANNQSTPQTAAPAPEKAEAPKEPVKEPEKAPALEDTMIKIGQNGKEIKLSELWKAKGQSYFEYCIEHVKSPRYAKDIEVMQKWLEVKKNEQPDA